jgi:hypothetical protein
MRKIFTLLVIAAINAVQDIFAAELDEGVLVLTDDNFDSELSKH